jgi:hypothetical protein
MGQVLDGILKKTIEEDFIVSTEYISDIWDIDNREQEFSVQVIYKDGVNVNMKIKLEVSVDGINFSEVTNSAQIVTDPTHSHIYDVIGTGVAYMRVKIEVTGGSMTIDKILYAGKRRH